MKDGLCQTTLMSSCDRVTIHHGKEEEINIIYMDASKASVSIQHDILITNEGGLVQIRVQLGGNPT